MNRWYVQHHSFLQPTVLYHEMTNSSKPKHFQLTVKYEKEKLILKAYP